MWRRLDFRRMFRRSGIGHGRGIWGWRIWIRVGRGRCGIGIWGSRIGRRRGFLCSCGRGGDEVDFDGVVFVAHRQRHGVGTDADAEEQQRMQRDGQDAADQEIAPHGLAGSGSVAMEMRVMPCFRT